MRTKLSTRDKIADHLGDLCEKLLQHPDDRLGCRLTDGKYEVYCSNSPGQEFFSLAREAEQFIRSHYRACGEDNN